MSKMAKEFAEKYLKEELDSRLKHLGGQPDALCQAYQAALEAMAPKKKCYVRKHIIFLTPGKSGQKPLCRHFLSFPV